MATQSNSQFCTKCYRLFFDGYPTQSSCPADGIERQGFAVGSLRICAVQGFTCALWNACIPIILLFFIAPAILEAQTGNETGVWVDSFNNIWTLYRNPSSTIISGTVDTSASTGGPGGGV